MSPQESSEALRNFISTNPSSRAALEWLSPDSEIGIEIGEIIFLTLVNRGGTAQILEEKAENPVFVVHAKPPAVEALVSGGGETAGELGEILLKEYLAGNIRVERIASWLHLIQHGYGWLTSIGVSKATDLLRKIRP